MFSGQSIFFGRGTEIAIGGNPRILIGGLCGSAFSCNVPHFSAFQIFFCNHTSPRVKQYMAHTWHGILSKQVGKKWGGSADFFVPPFQRFHGNHVTSHLEVDLLFEPIWSLRTLASPLALNKLASYYTVILFAREAVLQLCLFPFGRTGSWPPPFVLTELDAVGGGVAGGGAD